MQIFARLVKVDEASRTVSGLIANEAVDRSGEVFDYDSSKPLFEAWSGGIAKATDGKSVGNVRAMHGNVAAGKLAALNMDDASKAITVDAKIIDDNEWAKVSEGVYTGFSIGGKYARKWKDDEGVQRYTAEPYEVSLVDLPCNPDAQFTVVKMDGAEEMRKFVTTTEAESLTKWVASLPDAEREALAKIAERKDVSPKSGEHKYGDVRFADEKNKKYPIDTPAHIRAAWNYINKPKNAAKYDSADLKSIKAAIVSAWKKKIDPEGPPSARNAKPAKKAAYFDCVASMLIDKQDAERCAKAAAELAGVEKGLWTVSSLATLLEQLDCIADDTNIEAEIEGDHSVLPAELRDAVKTLSEILVHMVAEEVEEMNAGDDVEVMELSAHGDLAKSIEDQKMTEELQKAHDEMKSELAKVVGERDELTKALAERDDLLTKAAEKITAQAEAIKKLEAEPLPVKAARLAVSKQADVVAADEAQMEKVLNPDGTVDKVRTALRDALKHPVATF